MSAVAKRVSKKRKFVADGVFYAELNKFLVNELSADGYAGVEVRTTPQKTDVIIRATHTQRVLGEKGRRIRELTQAVSKRYGFKDGAIEILAERVMFRGLCAFAQAESLRIKLIFGLAVRRACYSILRFVMESGAKGCEVIVSGKVRGQRAKAMKFCDGYMKKSGYATTEYVNKAVRNVLLKTGILGLKVAIMLPHDPTGKKGPKKPLPDVIEVLQPKKDNVVSK